MFERKLVIVSAILYCFFASILPFFFLSLFQDEHLFEIIQNELVAISAILSHLVAFNAFSNNLSSCQVNSGATAC